MCCWSSYFVFRSWIIACCSSFLCKNKSIRDIRYEIIWKPSCSHDRDIIFFFFSVSLLALFKELFVVFIIVIYIYFFLIWSNYLLFYYLLKLEFVLLSCHSLVLMFWVLSQRGLWICCSLTGCIYDMQGMQSIKKK